MRALIKTTLSLSLLSLMIDSRKLQILTGNTLAPFDQVYLVLPLSVTGQKVLAQLFPCFSNVLISDDAKNYDLGGKSPLSCKIRHHELCVTASYM